MEILAKIKAHFALWYICSECVTCILSHTQVDKNKHLLLGAQETMNILTDNISVWREYIPYSRINHDKYTSPKSLLSLLLFLFMTLIPHSVPLYRLFFSLYLNTQPFAQGASIFSSEKKMHGAYLLPSYHQTVKKHLLPTKPFRISVYS